MISCFWYNSHFTGWYTFEAWMPENRQRDNNTQRSKGRFTVYKGFSCHEYESSCTHGSPIPNTCIFDVPRSSSVTYRTFNDIVTMWHVDKRILCVQLLLPFGCSHFRCLLQFINFIVAKWKARFPTELLIEINEFVCDENVYTTVLDACVRAHSAQCAQKALYRAASRRDGWSGVQSVGCQNWKICKTHLIA